MRSLKEFLKRRSRRDTAPATAGASSTVQGRLLYEGRVSYKDLTFPTSWKSIWVELRESLEWRPILGFYEADFDDHTKELIDSIEVCYVKRVMTKRCTLRVESAKGKRRFYLQFSTDLELYDWLEEIYTRCPGSGVVDYDTFSHDLHIREPDEDGNITGFPRTVAEYVDMYSVRSSTGSLPTHTPAPELSEPGLSSADTGPLQTPNISTFFKPPEVEVVSDTDNDSIASVPRTDLPNDHIGFAPGRLALPYKPRGLPKTVVTIGQSKAVERPITQSPESPVLNVAKPQIVVGRHAVFHVRDLTRGINRLSRYAVANGGYSDVYKAKLTEKGSTHIVGVKVIRELAPASSPSLNRKFAKRLKSELHVWHHLDHPNVVKLLGVCRNFGPRPALVSLWHENGHVMRYLEDLGEGVTLSLKLKLILGIANGLAYLHSFSTPVLHCDLKASNVLVNAEGNACLTDFGLSSLFENLSSSRCLSDSRGLGGSIRWMAVELLCPPEGPNGVRRFSPATDVSSFGSTMLEILSGKMPYHHCRNDAQVILEISRGVRHKREDTGISLMYWQLMERCWADPPEDRPSCPNIINELEYYCWFQRCEELQNLVNSNTMELDEARDSVSSGVGVSVGFAV